MIRLFCLLLLLVFMGNRVFSAEGDSAAYRRFIIQRCYYKTTARVVKDTSMVMTVAALPHYEIPKGNVFCRMEDYLTKRTGVWIKVGVWSQQK